MKFSLSDKMSVGVSECDVVGRANEADFRGAFCQRAAQPSHSSSKLARCGKMGIFAVHSWHLGCSEIDRKYSANELLFSDDDVGHPL